MDEKDNDIRWKQRFENFENAFLQFKSAIGEFGHSTENIIKEGIIQHFEFTHELAWKVMKDFLMYEGVQDVIGSRSATRESFNKGIIANGEEWMNMLETRNLTVHTYQKNILEEQFLKIRDDYFPLIEEFYKNMKKRT
jgi:nucleotidyltransferase substrate binding protein (TIGR01987 family)